MDLIFEAFENKPIVTLSESLYLVNTLTDHVPPTAPDFVRQVTSELIAFTDFSLCDKVIGEEDRGGYMTAITAFLVNKSFSLVKWHPLGLTGEVSVDFRSAYTAGRMYLNGIREGDRVIVVEDFIDTGGTMIALVDLLRKMGAVVVDILAVVEKIDNRAGERIFEQTGLRPKVLATISIEGGVSRVVERFRPSEA